MRHQGKDQQLCYIRPTEQMKTYLRRENINKNLLTLATTRETKNTM